MSNRCVVILAAGDGKRMKSNKPKVLCEVLFRPMLGWVLDACQKADAGDICIIKGKGSELLDTYLDGKYETVMQNERLGTGHALMQAAFFWKHIAAVIYWFYAEMRRLLTQKRFVKHMNFMFRAVILLQ